MEFVLPDNNALLHYGEFYKFLSVKSALKTLKSGTLRYSNPTVFNDPLDCSELLFNFKIPKKELTTSFEQAAWEKEIIRDIIKTRHGLSWEEYFNPLIPTIDLNSFNGSLDKKQKTALFQNLTRNEFSKEVIEKYRVTCFSKEYYSKTSFLMWSHYAESHKGICLEFNNKKETDLNKLKKFTPVNVQYKSELPKIYSQVDFELNNWLWIKSLLFKYEDEVRIIRKLKKAQIGSNFAFSKNYLTKIIFGYNTSDKTIQSIKNILQNNYEISNIDFEKMYIDEKSWQLTKNKFDIHNMISYKV